ncbi:MAG: hypothetical protein LUF35_01710 [Lachnospiraceae bacterium]|nr:hypothetical protein [Lachnospiraceae bacterium]
MERNVNIIRDVDGNQIVLINDIRFKGKRKVNWEDVEDYLKQYVGEFYSIAATGEIIYIGAELPDEYTRSNYTAGLKGGSAKANAAQALPEMIEIATGKRFEENRKDKHSNNAKFGWYRYNSRFALPVYDEYGDVERYNIFHALMLMRHAKDGKLYLYDIIEIKKNEKPFPIRRLYSVREPASLFIF